MEENFDKVSQILLPRLRDLKPTNKYRLNTIQITAQTSFPSLLTATEIKEKKNIKANENLMGLDEFAEYVAMKATDETNSKEIRDQAIHKILELLDQFEENLKGEIQKIREKIAYKVLPSPICTRFCEQILDGELNLEEHFQKALEDLCRQLDGYRKAKVPTNFEQIQERMNDRRDKVVNFIRDLPDTILRAINPKGISSDPPERFTRLFGFKALSTPLAENIKGSLSYSLDQKSSYLMGSDGTLALLNISNKSVEASKRISLDTNLPFGVVASPFKKKIAVFQNPCKISIMGEDFKEFSEISTQHPGESTIESLVWLSEDRIMAGYRPPSLAIFDLKSNDLICSAQLPFSNRTFLIYYPPDSGSSNVYIGDSSGSISFIDKHKLLKNYSTCPHGINKITCLDVSSEKNLLFSGATDKNIKVFDLKKMTNLHTFNVDDVPVEVYHSPESTYLIMATQSKKFYTIDLKKKQKNNKGIAVEGSQVKGFLFSFKKEEGIVVSETGAVVGYSIGNY